MRDSAPAGAASRGFAGASTASPPTRRRPRAYGVRVRWGPRIGMTPRNRVVAAPLDSGAGRRSCSPHSSSTPRARLCAPAAPACSWRRRAGVHARALTHATAKWEWLRERAGGRHVLRLSYDSVPEWLRWLGSTPPCCWAVPRARRVVDFARVRWRRPAIRSPTRATTCRRERRRHRPGGVIVGEATRRRLGGCRRLLIPMFITPADRLPPVAEARDSAVLIPAPRRLQELWT